MDGAGVRPNSALVAVRGFAARRPCREQDEAEKSWRRANEAVADGTAKCIHQGAAGEGIGRAKEALGADAGEQQKSPGLV